MSSRWDRMSPQAREAARIRNQRWRLRHREDILAQDRIKRAAEPERYRAYRAAYYQEHRDELIAKGRARLATKPAHIHVLYQHGMQPSELDALYEAQGGRCAICDQPQPKRGDGCLHIDHDHTTGERRGLICNSCNRALPLFEKYGGTWALRALAYLGDPPLRRLRKEKAS